MHLINVDIISKKITWKYKIHKIIIIEKGLIKTFYLFLLNALFKSISSISVSIFSIYSEVKIKYAFLMEKLIYAVSPLIFIDGVLIKG